MDKNQKKLIILGILIALGLAAWVIKEGIREGDYLSAGNALVAAEDAAALEDVMKTHAATPSAASAAVLLSDSQWEQGQQDDSIATLKAEIAANPEHPATAAAYARLAARLSSQGKTEEAKAAFQDIIDRPQARFFAPYALISLGQIAKGEGDIEKAKDYFRQASEGYPGNPLASAASRALQFADFKMPEEIDPPAPEATPEAGGVDATEFNPSALSGGQANPLFSGGESVIETPDAPSIPEDETPTPSDTTEETPSE
ncbi:tol-pal system YbgF family protein [Haloferula chungangensis]|uniref:Tol-pal system YbgF family protein n=1 Tax=Haloferula chungangensis TaxID=1048331 RepID=A0ABW2LCM4_9BACT